MTWPAERTPAVAPPAPARSPARFGALSGVTSRSCSPVAGRWSPKTPWTTSATDRAHRDRARERRRPPPRAEHDERDEAEQRELERDAGDDRRAGAHVPQRRAERAAAHDQRHRAQRAQQHERVVVLPAEAVDEDERVEAREHEAALRRAAEADREPPHERRGTRATASAATAFHVQYAVWSGRGASA